MPNPDLNPILTFFTTQLLIFQNERFFHLDQIVSLVGIIGEENTFPNINIHDTHTYTSSSPFGAVSRCVCVGDKHSTFCPTNTQ